MNFTRWVSPVYTIYWFDTFTLTVPRSLSLLLSRVNSIPGRVTFIVFARQVDTRSSYARLSSHAAEPRFLFYPRPKRSLPSFFDPRSAVPLTETRHPCAISRSIRQACSHRHPFPPLTHAFIHILTRRDHCVYYNTFDY